MSKCVLSIFSHMMWPTLCLDSYPAQNMQYMKSNFIQRKKDRRQYRWDKVELLSQLFCIGVEESGLLHRSKWIRHAPKIIMRVEDRIMLWWCQLQYQLKLMLWWLLSRIAVGWWLSWYETDRVVEEGLILSSHTAAIAPPRHFESVFWCSDSNTAQRGFAGPVNTELTPTKAAASLIVQSTRTQALLTPEQDCYK